MRYPWQTWLVFGLCLTLALGAMGWLTVQAIELDRAEAAAREKLEESQRQAIALQRRAEELQSQAELEELVSSALWRMDTALAPVLAQEAARPYFVYRPYFSLPSGKAGKGIAKPVPSPLLKQPSPFVKLHFQCDSQSVCSSPQVPPPAYEEAAIENGVSRDDLAHSRELLSQLQEQVRRDELLACLPDQMLPAVAMNDANWEFNSAWALQFGPNTRRNNFEQAAGEFPSQPQIAQGQQSALPVQGEDPVGQQPASPAQQLAPSRPAPNPSDVAAQPIPTLPNQPGQSQGYSNAQPQQQQGELDPMYQVVGNPYAPNGTPITSQQLPPPLATDNEGRVQYSRAGVKWQDRNRALQSYAAQTLVQTRGANSTEYSPAPSSSIEVSEGVTRPLWVGSELFLARRVNVGGETLVQGCWLDWPALRERLLEDVRDLLPQAELVPVSAATPDGSRLLATLPIELKVPTTATIVTPGGETVPLAAATVVSPLSISLWIAWGCLVLAAAAVASLMLGVVSLSERRAAFVAAVTHELRTPLTTFRMYAEMLAENMVPDEARRQEYLDTLRVESDRLYHLVENVLSYARLERGPSPDRRQRVTLDSQLERMETRLRDRAASAQMELVVEADEAARKLEVQTDPTAVEQIFFNLVDNACKYAALAEDRRIHVAIARDGGNVRCTVRDHGPGISASAADRLFQPFSKSVHEAADSAPGVGLGLALSQRLAGELGGDLTLAPCDSARPGACFVLTLPLAT